jgi:hypothetical protein
MNTRHTIKNVGIPSPFFSEKKKKIRKHRPGDRVRHSTHTNTAAVVGTRCTAARLAPRVKGGKREKKKEKKKLTRLQLFERRVQHPVKHVGGTRKGRGREKEGRSKSNKRAVDGTP